MKLLEVENLSAGYGKAQVLFDLNFYVPKGGITSILGPNGAGKSTTFKAIFQLVNIYGGKVYLFGKDITNMPTEDIFNKYSVAYVPQEDKFYPNLTVQENLETAALRAIQAKKDGLKEVYDLFPKLKERKNQIAHTLSGGEKQMLAIGRSLMRSPELIVYDEPTAGLAPVIVNRVFEMLKEVSKKNITIFLAEEKIGKSISVSKKVLLIKDGEIVYDTDKNKRKLTMKKVKSIYM
jgi:branched-chain amino acid transport system ATP-binding protein